LGEWALEEACRQLACWRAELPEAVELRVSVNVSKKQLTRVEFLPSMERILATYPEVGAALNIEVTESAIMSDPELIAEVLGKLRAFGMRIHMDDFGTGHSSLSCLHRFPIDVLKIDRSFVMTMQSNPDYEAVVHAIISLAHHMGVKVVAEGVELASQLEALRSLECEYVQGYLFSKPLDAAHATRWIMERGAVPCAS
jgi:Amt family ammonium transporter